MRGKIFTRAEADRMVPLIKRIVVNVRARRRLIDGKRARLAAGEGRKDGDAGGVSEAISRLEDELHGFRQELEELGCILRDPAAGIVECFGELHGEIVYFSWRPGEAGFGHWHPLDTSHTKVKPLPAMSSGTAVD